MNKMDIVVVGRAVVVVNYVLGGCGGGRRNGSFLVSVSFTRSGQVTYEVAMQRGSQMKSGLCW